MTTNQQKATKLTANQLTTRANNQSKLYGVKYTELKKNPIEVYKSLGVFPTDAKYSNANNTNRQSYLTKQSIKIARENLNKKYEYDHEDVVGGINANFSYTYPKDPTGKKLPIIYHDGKYANGINTQRFKFDRKLKKIEDNLFERIQAEIYPLHLESIDDVKIDRPTTVMRREGGTLIYRKMKEGNTYDLGVDFVTKNEKWNTNNGTCVFDWIYHKYAKGRGMKKLLGGGRENAYRNLEGIFGLRTLEEGVTCSQLQLFCMRYDIGMFALDKNKNCIIQNKSESQNLPALVFIISNDHFNPIEDKAMIKSISHKEEDKTNKVFYKIKTDEKKEVKKYSKIVYPEEDDPTGNDYATYIFEKLKTIPFGNSNLRVDNGKIISFVLHDVLYLTEPPNKNFVDFVVDTKGKYSGESPFGVLSELTPKYFDKIESKLSKIVYDTLFTKGIKDRNHYGATRNVTYLCDEIDGKTILENMIDEGEIVITDINKCYSNCIYNPLDNFIVYGVDDEWENYHGELKTGLYYVETDDLTLMTKTNIYSNKIIEKALSVGIKLKITKQLIHKQTHINEEVIDKDYFKPLFEDIKELCEGNPTVIKLLNNLIVGMLGKTETKNYTSAIDTNPDDIWEYFMKHNANNNRLDSDSIILKQLNENLHLYGFITKIRKLDITLPIWIQILDWSNISLYEMGEAVGGEIIFRHTDLIVSIGGKIPYDKINDKWGKYKVEDKINPKKLLGLMRTDRGINITKFHNENWKDNKEFYSSNQFKDIIDYATEKGGLLIQSKAGTGKSYVVKQGFKERDDVLYMSFTNKASRNISGKTIHRTLMLNKINKLTKDSYNNFKNKKYVVVDEIGMCPTYLLKLLNSIKINYPKLTWICMGDARQLEPVEEGRIKSFDVFGSSLVKEICNFNRIELTERHRYDEKLGLFLDNGYENGDWSGLKFEKQEVEDLVTSRNICYFNNTRHRINKLCNDHMAKDKESIRIGDDDKSMMVYSGLKVVAIVSNKALDFFNSEEFVVDCFDDNEVVLSSTTDNNLIYIDHNELLNYFDLNYIGTTHRSQGDTYDGKVCLFDFNKIKSDKHIIYTACSRATKFDNVVIVKY
jgi:hypothetical protein